MIEQIIAGEQTVNNLPVDENLLSQLEELGKTAYYFNYLDIDREIKTVDDFWKFAAPKLRVGYFGTSLDALFDIITGVKIPPAKKGIIILWDKSTYFKEHNPEFYNAFMDMLIATDKRWRAKNKVVFLLLGNGSLPFKTITERPGSETLKRRFQTNLSQILMPQDKDVLVKQAGELIVQIRDIGLTVNYLSIINNSGKEMLLENNPGNKDELIKMYDSLLSIYPAQHALKIIADKHKGMNNATAITLEFDLGKPELLISFREDNPNASEWIDQLKICWALKEQA